LVESRYKRAKEVIDTFGVKTDVCRRVEEEFLGKDARLFKVDIDVPGQVYLLDSQEGVEIASQPELVGSDLSAKALALAEKASRILVHMIKDDQTVFLHVLRGSPGYMLHEALRRHNANIREIYIRISSHAVPGESSVTYGSLGEIPSMIENVIVADTVATGQTLESAFKYLVKIGELKGLRFKRVFIYGFLSEPGVKKVATFLDSLDVESVFIGIEDLSALASNNFDMPLYGLDLDLPGKNPLGGTTDTSILEKMIDYYFPGLDQPGDWSERQCILFTGESMEHGRIREHLEKTLVRLEASKNKLSDYGWYPEWLERVYETRKRRLEEALTLQHCQM